MDEAVAFLGGVVFTLVAIGFACTPPHDLIKAHTTAAMGCTVISKEEAAPTLEGLSTSAVYWRCKDGKVYVR